MGFYNDGRHTTSTDKVALNTSAPTYFRLAGHRVSPGELRSAANQITGEKLKPIRSGGQGWHGVTIKIPKTFSPSKDNFYFAWQGMQHMHNIIHKRVEIDRLVHNPYPAMY